MTDDARARGWGWPGAPGSAEERAYRTKLTTIVVAGIRLVVRKEVAGIFNGFLGELSAGGYRLDVRADDWGWANRDIRGRPGVKSNHAWGLAVDLNATVNPMTSDGHIHTDMPPGTSALAARWGLRWGANYTGGRVDPMHFEFMGRPADVGRYPLGHAEPVPASLPQIASTRHTLEGEPVMRIDVPVRTDSSGNGYTGPDEGVVIEHAKVLAVTSHAPHSPAGGDQDYLLAPVGHHEWNGNLVVQVVGGPKDATVYPMVLVAD